MLGDKEVHVTIPVTDIRRALDFYTKILGLGAEMQGDDYAYLKAGGDTGIALYKRGPSKADHTLAEFEVDDVEAVVDEMRDAGVEFEEYDIPEMNLKTENGIASMGDSGKAAWFKDPDGNILAIFDQVR